MDENEVLIEAFRAADKNGDGLISFRELKGILEELDEWDDEEFEILFYGADADGDGKLCYKEFVDWVMSSEETMFATERIAEEEGGSSCGSRRGSRGSSSSNYSWCSNEEGGSGGSSEEEDSEWDDEDEELSDWSDFWDEEEEVPVGEPTEEVLEDPAQIDNSMPFEDEEFPATIESIGKTSGDTASGVTGEQNNDWVRLIVTAGDDGALFKDISPSEVQQGCLGNCWFLAAMASVASYPGWIKQIFSKNPTMRADGRYEVRLYHPGKKEFIFVTVSDEVPATNGHPSFSRLTARNEIWAPLIEKAFAKMCKTYAATEGGLPAWGMYYLCGSVGEQWQKRNEDDGTSLWFRKLTQFCGDDSFPLERADGIEALVFKGDDDDQCGPAKLWKALMAYTAKNYPMGCCVFQKQDDMQGLIDGHAYSFIAVREVKTHEGKNLKMCKIRNPHGETEWQGRWGDHSDMWTKHPNVKKELHFEPKEDGTFWMAFHDFTTYFDTCSVVKRSMPMDGVHVDKVRAMRAAKGRRK